MNALTYDTMVMTRKRREVGFELAAMIQDDRTPTHSDNDPYLAMANILLPIRAKQRPEDREIFTGPS